MKWTSQIKKGAQLWDSLEKFGKSIYQLNLNCYLVSGLTLEHPVIFGYQADLWKHAKMLITALN